MWSTLFLSLPPGQKKNDGNFVVMGWDASVRHCDTCHSAVGLAQVVEGWTPPMWSGGRCASRNDSYISKMVWRDLIIISFGPLSVPYFAMYEPDGYRLTGQRLSVVKTKMCKCGW